MRLLNTLRFIANHPLNSGDKAGAIFRFVKWQIGSRILPGSVIVSFVDNMKLVIEPGMTGATGNLYCGLDEYEDMAFLLHFLRPGDLFIDVGANIGSYSVLAAAAGADVLSFEPGERYTDLLLNMAVNGISADCRRVAVGADAGTIQFTQGLDSTNRVAMSGEKFTEVEIVRLDDVVDRNATLVKIDVEGYELEVLKGGLRTFGSADAVILELNGQSSRYGHGDGEIRELMDSLGFYLVGYEPKTRSIKDPDVRNNSIYVRGDVTKRLSSSREFIVQGRSV